ncbi:MAG TPA: DUF5666 domain-containing protein [Candidatus Angelobacter sp.]|nr:DUF5666 domain-containing protein [Candidatus Angelobacter sp.]
MHRSPIALLSVLFVAMFAASVRAQSNPASPKQGSAMPETPVPGAQPQSTPASQPPSTATDSKTDSTVTAPEIAPSAVQPVQDQAPDSKAATQPKSNAQPDSAAQQKDIQQKTGQPAGDANSKSSAPQAVPPTPPSPKTEILDSSATSGALVTDGHDPILDPAPVPRTTTTLVGGTITGLDRMRNRLTVQVFGGGHWKVNFDERTHIFRNGAETTQLALKKGERVYVDTQLDTNHHDIFARNIRVGVVALPADADGQITDVDLRHGEVTLRDTLNSVPVRFAVDQGTRISSGQTPSALKDLRTGTLVHVRFAASQPNRGLAREIDIIAAPGSNFTFAGRVTFLDMHRGILAVQNSVDDKNYEIHFFPNAIPDRNNLGIGTEVRVVATFEGSRYSAQSVNLMKAPGAEDR